MHAAFALLLGIGLALTTLVTLAAPPPPAPAACATGKILWFAGSGTPRMPLLLTFAHRPVGGGSVDASGHWALPLQIGHERPGIYTIEVRSRNDRALIAAFQCAVGIVLPTPAPTQAPIAPAPTQTPTAEQDFDRNGDGAVTCADFDTQAEAQRALEAGHKNLDNNGDGVPCEKLK